MSENPSPRELKIKLGERLLKKLAKIQLEFENCSEYEAIEILIDEKFAAISTAKPKRAERGSKNQRYIPRSVKEKVTKPKCEGCGARTNLNLDHVRPVAFGGQSTADNLRTLCFTCNQRAWFKNSTPCNVVATARCNDNQYQLL